MDYLNRKGNTSLRLGLAVSNKISSCFNSMKSIGQVNAMLHFLTLRSSQYATVESMVKSMKK